MQQRLAWFSPIPPERSAVARHSAELLPALARGRTIDVYAPAPAGGDQLGAAAVLDPGEFESRHATEPYDLVVYQLGAAPAHDNAVWPFLLRHPGLVVLHDDNFHAARARMLLAEGRGDAYRAELARSHPGVPAEVGNLGAAGLLGGLERLWPLRRTALDAARAVLAPNAWLAARIREEAPEVSVYAVEPGVPDVAGSNADGEAARRRCGVPEDAVVFAADDLAPAGRLARLLRALAALPEGTPAWRLLLCGDDADAGPLLAEAQALGLGPRVSAAGRIADDELPAQLAATDVGVSLSWPPSRTVSAAWLRWLAAGKPTIVTDLAHASDVPALDPRGWTVAGRPGARDAAGRAVEPVAVAIDILDEDHSLGLAAARLAADAALRAELGGAARRLWAARFTFDRMAAGYARAIDDACAVPLSPS